MIGEGARLRAALAPDAPAPALLDGIHVRVYIDGLPVADKELRLHPPRMLSRSSLIEVEATELVRE